MSAPIKKATKEPSPPQTSGMSEAPNAVRTGKFAHQYVDPVPSRPGNPTPESTHQSDFSRAVRGQEYVELDRRAAVRSTSAQSHNPLLSLQQGASVLPGPGTHTPGSAAQIYSPLGSPRGQDDEFSDPESEGKEEVVSKRNLVQRYVDPVGVPRPGTASPLSRRQAILANNDSGFGRAETSQVYQSVVEERKNAPLTSGSVVPTKRSVATSRPKGEETVSQLVKNHSSDRYFYSLPPQALPASEKPDKKKPIVSEAQQTKQRFQAVAHGRFYEAIQTKSQAVYSLAVTIKSKSSDEVNEVIEAIRKTNGTIPNSTVQSSDMLRQILNEELKLEAQKVHGSVGEDVGKRKRILLSALFKFHKESIINEIDKSFELSPQNKMHLASRSIYFYDKDVQTETSAAISANAGDMDKIVPKSDVIALHKAIERAIKYYTRDTYADSDLVLYESQRHDAVKVGAHQERPLNPEVKIVVEGNDPNEVAGRRFHVFVLKLLIFCGEMERLAVRNVEEIALDGADETTLLPDFSPIRQAGTVKVSQDNAAQTDQITLGLSGRPTLNFLDDTIDSEAGHKALSTRSVAVQGNPELEFLRSARDTMLPPPQAPLPPTLRDNAAQTAAIATTSTLVETNESLNDLVARSELVSQQTQHELEAEKRERRDSLLLAAITEEQEERVRLVGESASARVKAALDLLRIQQDGVTNMQQQQNSAAASQAQLQRISEETIHKLQQKHESDLAEANRRAQDAEHQAGMMQDELRRTKEKLDAQLRYQQDEKEKVMGLELQLEKTRSGLRELESYRDADSSTIEALREELLNLEARRHRDVVARKVELSARKGVFEEEEFEARSQLTSAATAMLEATHSIARSALETSKQQTDKAAEVSQRAGKAVDVKDRELQEMSDRMEKSEKELSVARKAIEEQEARNKALESEQETTTRKLEDTRRKAASVNAEKDAMSRELERMREEQAVFAQRRREIESLVQQSQTENADLRIVLESKNDELAATKAQLTRLQRPITTDVAAMTVETQSSLADMDESLSTAQHRNAELERRLKQLVEEQRAKEVEHQTEIDRERQLRHTSELRFDEDIAARDREIESYRVREGRSRIDAESRERQLREELKSLGDRLAAANEEVRAKDDMITRIKANERSKNTEEREAQTIAWEDPAVLRKNLDQAEQALSEQRRDLGAQIQRMEQYLLAAEQERDDAKRDLSQVQRDKETQLRTERERLGRDHAELLLEKEAEHENAMSTLRVRQMQELARLQSENDLLKAAQATSTTSQPELNQLRRELELLRSRQSAHDEEKAQKDREIAALQRDQKRAEEESRTQSETVRQLQLERVRQASEMEELQQQVRTLQDQLQQAREQAASSQRDADTSRAQLEQHMSQRTSGQPTQLYLQLTEMRRQFDALLQENAFLRAQGDARTLPSAAGSTRAVNESTDPRAGGNAVVPHPNSRGAILVPTGTGSTETPAGHLRQSSHDSSVRVLSNASTQMEDMSEDDRYPIIVDTGRLTITGADIQQARRSLPRNSSTRASLQQTFQLRDREALVNALAAQQDPRSVTLSQQMIQNFHFDGVDFTGIDPRDFVTLRFANCAFTKCVLPAGFNNEKLSVFVQDAPGARPHPMNLSELKTYPHLRDVAIGTTFPDDAESNIIRNAREGRPFDASNDLMERPRASTVNRSGSSSSRLTTSSGLGTPPGQVTSRW